MAKQLTEEQIHAKLASINTHKVSIAAAIQPLKDKYARFTTQESKLMAQLNAMKRDDLAHIMFTISAHDEWQALLPKQAWPNGFWGEVSEQAWKLKLKYREAPSAELLEFIEKWLKLTKRGVIEIFRYDCAEDGSWLAEIREGKWVVYDQRDYDFYRHGKVEAEFTDVVEMVKYVAEHHWFEGGTRPERIDFGF